MKFLLFLFSIQALCFIANATCTTGEIRLVNGTTPDQGRVEICINGVWGTVCDDFWGHVEAEIVCRQLGYNTVGATYFAGPLHSYGEGTGPILLDDVQCSGNECSLLNCSHTAIIYGCSHSEDVGVSCPPLDTCTPFNSIPSPTASTIMSSKTCSASIANSVEPVPLDAVGSNRYHTSNNRATDIPQYEMTTAAYEYVDNEPAYDRPSNDNKNRSVSDPYETIPGEEDK